MSDSTSVKVALRIRPLNDKEQNSGCQNVLEVYNNLHQIKIKNRDQAFTYSYVFDYHIPQKDVYEESVQNLVEKLFSGYNVTILAYGQTGSGKTYSMGTCYSEADQEAESVGIIPRAVSDIFKKINDSNDLDVQVSVTFMELYKEVLYDLLSEKSREQSIIDIREDVKQQIIFPGLTEVNANSTDSVLKCLCKGSKFRATGSTAMNMHSSRSHAVFTMNLIIGNKNEGEAVKTAKFHLVDLAGSERSKKTQATGLTFREGININQGLLALGNVISALGDERQNKGFINYRDSNLTRLLKDSLGGNSITLMVACVSPADSNLEETLCTLRYADRALKIKNKPVVNQDAKDAQITSLQKLVQDLRVQLANQGGVSNVCPAEIELKMLENETLKQKVRDLTAKLSNVLNEYCTLSERNMIIQETYDKTMSDLQEFKTKYEEIFKSFESNIRDNKFEEFRSHLVELNDLFSDKIYKILGQFKSCDSQILEFDVQNSRVSDTQIQQTQEFTEEHENFTKQQLELNVKLQDLQKRLAVKEDLAQKLTSNNNHIIDFVAMAENEAKLKSLEKEKEELLQQLKDAHTAGISSKLAEQRRKKVQELEHQITELNKKVQEQARLIKLKEKDDARIRSLNTEIISMKQNKVQLIKNMRSEAEKFRVWKQEREREVCKLKDQDRKRQNQIVKMEAQYQRQQNVMKRKMEHVAAINKRLAAAIQLRKNVQESKGANNTKNTQWVGSELDVHVRIIEAKETLSTLMEDRAVISGQLNGMKKNPNKVNSEEYKQLEEEIQTRSAQIQDLQQKILDSENDKVKSRIDTIQTMGEAKSVVKTLFELVGNYRKNELKMENQLTEVQNVQTQQTIEIENLKQQLLEETKRHENNYSIIQKENEEKVALLLNQCKHADSSELRKELEREKERVQELQKECERLNEVINDVNSTATQIQIPVKRALDSTFTKIKVEPESPPPSKPKTKKTSATQLLDAFSEEIDTSFELFDDPNDPDWGNTPNGKKLQSLRSANNIRELHDRQTIKRFSDGGCACKGACINRYCGCKKFGKGCGSSCRCNINTCKNRLIKSDDDNTDQENDNMVHSSEGSYSEDSFKRPRLVDVSNVTKNKRTKKLYFDKSDE